MKKVLFFSFLSLSVLFYAFESDEQLGWALRASLETAAREQEARDLEAALARSIKDQKSGGGGSKSSSQENKINQLLNLLQEVEANLFKKNDQKIFELGASFVLLKTINGMKVFNGSVLDQVEASCGYHAFKNVIYAMTGLNSQTQRQQDMFFTSLRDKSKYDALTRQMWFPKVREKMQENIWHVQVRIETDICAEIINSFLFKFIPDEILQAFPDIKNYIITVDRLDDFTKARTADNVRTDKQILFCKNIVEASEGLWGFVVNTGGHWIGLVLQKHRAEKRWYHMNSAGNGYYHENMIDPIINFFNNLDKEKVKKMMREHVDLWGEI